MKNVTINNHIYPNVYIGFNVMCKWARLGIDISNTENAMMSFPLIQAYVAELMKSDLEKAGNEIDAHLMNGGTFEDIANGLTEAFTESGFFRAIGKSEQTEEKETSKKTSKE